MNIDYTISNFFANNHLGGAFDDIMLFISKIANSGYIFIIIALFLLTFNKTRKLGFGFLICLLFVLVINNMMLKNIFDRLRPFEKYPEFIPNVIGELPDSKSFPSGHTVSSFAIASYLFCYKKKYLKSAVFFLIFAVFVGFSRIYLVHHYFTDVMAGLCVGIVFGICAYFIQKYSIYLFLNLKSKKNNNR